MCVTVNVGACSKRVPWVHQFVLEGADYTSGTFLMELRPLAGDTGTPLVQLANAAPGAQGVSANYDPAYVDPVTAAVFPATIFTVIISEATMEALVTGSPAGAAVVARYDMHLTPSGGSKFIPFRGKFIYEPGVTI